MPETAPNSAASNPETSLILRKNPSHNVLAHHVAPLAALRQKGFRPEGGTGSEHMHRRYGPIVLAACIGIPNTIQSSRKAKPAATKMVLSLILLLCRRMRDLAYEAGLRRGERCSTLHPARLPRDERVVEKG